MKQPIFLETKLPPVRRLYFQLCFVIIKLIIPAYSYSTTPFSSLINSIWNISTMFVVNMVQGTCNLKEIKKLGRRKTPSENKLAENSFYFKLKEISVFIQQYIK